jgi:hypothetical protein
LGERLANLTADDLSRQTVAAGSLTDLGVLDLLAAIHQSKRSAALWIRCAEQRANLFFRDGDIIDADLGSMHGERAVYSALGWTEGSFEVQFREVGREDVMRTSTRRVLWEGRRRLEERARRMADLPDLRGVFDVNCERLLECLAELPDEINLVLKHCDGQRSLLEVVRRSELDELSTLTALSRLIADGLLVDVANPSSASSPRQVSFEHRSTGLVSTLPPPPTSIRSTLDYELNATDRLLRQAPLPSSSVVNRLPGERTLRGIRAPQGTAGPSAESPTTNDEVNARPTVRAAPLEAAALATLEPPSPPRRRRRRRRQRPALELAPLRRATPTPQSRAPGAERPPVMTGAPPVESQRARQLAQPSDGASASAAQRASGDDESTALRTRLWRAALSLAIVLFVCAAMILMAM